MTGGRVAPLRPRREFRHEAFFYAREDDFVAAVSSFIREGLADGEPTFVVLSAEKVAHLQDELGGEQPGVWYADMATVGHNPARLIPAWHDFVDEHLGRGVGLRGVGEPIRPHLDPDVLVEFQHHERLLNLAFPDLLDLWLLCPYDTAALPPAIINEARHSHASVLEDGTRHASGRYHDVDPVGNPPGDPLPEPPSGSVEVRFDASCLTTLRAMVADGARQAGLSADREADLVLSVNEIAANSIQYGGGSGTLHIWRREGAVVCEIRDEGVITDPLVGRLAPGTSPESSRGLWVVNQLCDLVQVRSSPAGTVVRLHMSLGSGRWR
jgi:anti-sigma regulatory factor (Ser/Thr protein kinase)